VKEFAWSFSALMRYESCPKQYYHINVIKDVKDEDTEFSADGKAIHQGLYRRICQGEKLPLNYRYLEPTAIKFVGMPGDTSGELKFAATRRFAPVQYFDPSVFVRVVVDLLNVRGTTALLVDWKTGKPKSGFTQLELSAAVLSCHLPEIETFKLAYVWLQNRKVTSHSVSKADLVSVWNNLLPRVAKIEEAIKTTNFPAKPSGLCRYCPVKSCPHWKPRDA
jgi:PD-(D/E)XK nuclease superfamily